MKPEDNTQETTTQEAPQRLFRVRVFQTQEVVTEHFDYDDAENKKEALRRAQNFIDDEKDLEKGSYRLEVEEIELPPVPTAEAGRPEPPIAGEIPTDNEGSTDQ